MTQAETFSTSSRAQARAFFGRRKGKQLRARQSGLVETLLPRLAIDLARPIRDPAALFAQDVREIHVEIGFGGGEHLAAAAGRARDFGFIGCEPFVNGLAKLLASVENLGLENIRLHAGDALDVLNALPNASIDRLYLLYPDPWPKRRQRKRRFVSDASLGAIARVLKTGGEFRFATDIDDYAAWTLARILRSPDFDWRAQTARDWNEPWRDWASTRYEAKALSEKRPPVYLSFLRAGRAP